MINIQITVWYIINSWKFTLYSGNHIWSHLGSVCLSVCLFIVITKLTLKSVFLFEGGQWSDCSVRSLVHERLDRSFRKIPRTSKSGFLRGSLWVESCLQHPGRQLTTLSPPWLSTCTQLQDQSEVRSLNIFGLSWECIQPHTYEWVYISLDIVGVFQSLRWISHSQNFPFMILTSLCLSQLLACLRHTLQWWRNLMIVFFTNALGVGFSSFSDLWG